MLNTIFFKTSFADSCLLGVRDPTPSKNIPHGFVAIPGLPESIDSVLVSHCPCQHKDDMLHQPVLRQKPSEFNIIKMILDPLMAQSCINLVNCFTNQNNACSIHDILLFEYCRSVLTLVLRYINIIHASYIDIANM